MVEIKQSAWFNEATANFESVVEFMTAGEDREPGSPTSDSDDFKASSMLLLPGGNGEEHQHSHVVVSAKSAAIQAKRSDDCWRGSRSGSSDDYNGREKRSNASCPDDRDSQSSFNLSSHGGCSSSGDDNCWSDDRVDDSIFGFSLTGLF
jgi:hypothetical protein